MEKDLVLSVWPVGRNVTNCPKLARPPAGASGGQSPVDLAALAVSSPGSPSLPMKLLCLFIGWCLLLVLCWPVALLALVCLPVVWLLSIPFRIVGIAVGAILALLKAVLYLPARLLGGGPPTKPA